MIGTGSPANPGYKPPGFVNGVSPNRGGEGHARGHLLGNQLGGSGYVEENIVTLYQNPTNNGDMKAIENSVRAYVETNQESVIYQVTPIHDGTDPFPTHVQIEAVGDDLQINEVIPNRNCQ